MIRAKTCARGRNSRVAASSISNSSLELVDRDAELEHEVAVGEHAALGPPGRAGGVDQRREVERRGRRTPLLELLVGDVLAERREDVDGVVGDRPDVVELVEVGAHLGQPGQVVGTLGDHGPGRGVAQDPLDLLGRGGLVDGDRDRAREPDRVVEQGPLVAGLADQRHPVAGLDASRDQALRHAGDLGQERGRGDVQPAVVGTSGEHRRVGGLARIADHVVGQVARCRDLDRQRRGVLTHRFLLEGREALAAGYRRRRRGSHPVASERDPSGREWGCAHG